MEAKAYGNNMKIVLDEEEFSMC